MLASQESVSFQYAKLPGRGEPLEAERAPAWSSVLARGGSLRPLLGGGSGGGCTGWLILQAMCIPKRNNTLLFQIRISEEVMHQ